ncbi:MAG: MerR family transcriptional regulator [Acidobacteriota bacterium]|nr:MerR family transcriptional regulator [Acidobacteriota bacterium]
MPAPKREVFRAAEVCEVANVQSYVLRTWESEFPQLGQVPTGGGPRVYGRTDIEMVLRIKALVFGEGLTLAGARRRLEEQPDSGEASALSVEEVLGDRARERVRFVRDGLRGILKLLDAGAQPQLVLVEPTAPARRNVKARRRADR